MFFKKQEKLNKRRKLPRWLPIWLDTPLRFCFKAFVAVFILSCCVCAFYWQKSSQYDLSKFSEMPARTVVLDANGDEYASLDGQRRRLITFEEIPKHLLKALYAREDADFETHNGVKFGALVRATLRNLKDLKYTQGASTLSMQLVKNTYNNRQKSLHRKFLEIALTLRLEANYQKSEIVTHYLNRIYFGAGCYGIEEAALHYFDKPTQDLSINESATLVGLIRGPSIFNPQVNYDKSIIQRNDVLDRMLACKFLTLSQVKKLKKQETKVATTKSSSKSTQSYTLQTIKRHLTAIGKLKQAQGGDFLDLKKNGLIIKTTIKPSFIKQIDQAHQSLPLANSSDYATAGVILESTTGAILAVNGGVDAKQYPYNLALDRKFRLGKIFHPFIYLASLEAGQNPIKGHPIQTGRQISIQEVIELSKSLGLNGKFPNSEDLFRGDTSASPLRLATAFAAFSNKGKVPHTYIIESISNKDGEILYQHPVKSKKIALAGNIDEIFKLYKIKKNQSLRLGTVKSNEAWSISTNPKITSVLWAGKLTRTAPKIDDSELLQKLQKFSNKLK